MAIALREYQQRSVDMLRDTIREGARAPCLVAPTGMGKTRLSAAIIESALAKGKRVLFVAPRRNLVTQTQRAFNDLGIDAAVIMAGIYFDPTKQVEIASIDTITARLDKPESNSVTALNIADILIFDEYHVYSSEKRAELINAIRGGVYGQKKLVIGLTATPCVTGGGGLGNICDKLVMPVDMPELISDGFLLQPHYYSAERPDISGIKMIGDDYNSKQLGVAYDGKIMGCVVENWLRIAAGTSTVVFTATRANAQDVVDKFLVAGVNAAYVDALTPDEERAMIFDGVASGRITVICNVMIIGLGTDIPRLQTVVFATATKSIARWCQGVGRVLRPYEGQDHANVIDHGNMTLDPGMGPVEYICDWSLDGKTTVQERVEKRKQENKEPVDVTCSSCKHVYRSKPACPKCGHRRKTKGEALEFHQADLKRLDTKKLTVAEKRNRDTPADEKIRFYGEVKDYAATKAKNLHYADHLYRSKFGVYPNAYKSAPRCTPSEETLSFIRSQNIRYAKGRSA